MKNEIIVSIKNLTSIFNKNSSNEIIAINNLSYEFEKNKIHYIIGNSGSGKSTLVQHFNGLIKSDKGNIKVGNFHILENKKKIPPIKKLRSFVSIVFQYPEYQIFKDTIKNEIMFGPISFGIHKKIYYEKNLIYFKKWAKDNLKTLNKFLKEEIKSENKFNEFILELDKSRIKFKKNKVIIKNHLLSYRKMIFKYANISMEQAINETALKYLKKLGLSKEYLDYSPFGLSGGQKRRVAIAGILAINPKILIFDEPTAGLDPKGVKEMLDIIKEEKKSGKTLFIITHSMDEVLECGDNVVVMDKGRIIASGKPYEVFLDNKLYSKTQISKPKVINFIDELNKKNKNYNELYKIKPKTCNDLAEAIFKII